MIRMKPTTTFDVKIGAFFESEHTSLPEHDPVLIRWKTRIMEGQNHLDRPTESFVQAVLGDAWLVIETALGPQGANSLHRFQN